MRKKIPRNGFELIIGPGVINGWRRKVFPSDQKEYELEVARMFSRALDDDLMAQPTDNEPFDVEVVSTSTNSVVAGIQLVEAYDDARRARDADRQQAIQQLCADEEFAKLLDGWELIIQTGTALALGSESNKASYQLAVIRSMLMQINWKDDAFTIRDQYVAVSGRRRTANGSLWYAWRGGLLPIPTKSPFLKAAESKLRKGYSRSNTPPFWLLVYSLSLAPTVSDCVACGALIKGTNIPFDRIFLFDVMEETIYQPLAEGNPDEVSLDPEGSISFQLDPASVRDAGAPDEFIEVKLFQGK